MRNFFLLFFIITACFNQASSDLPEQIRYPDHPTYSMYTNPWRFMEQIFIIEPELELQKKFPQVLQMAAAIAGAIPGSIWFVKQAWGQSKNRIIHTIGSLSLTILLSYLFYIITHGLFERKTHGDVFKNFVITWPNNKQHTPPIFHELFDFINKEYCSSASEKYLHQVAPDIISRITQAIYEQYPEKYNEKVIHKNYFPRWLQWTMIALSTAIILKLATSATKDLLTIVENKNVINILPIKPGKKTIKDFNDRMNLVIKNGQQKPYESPDGDDEDQKQELDPETEKVYAALFNKFMKEQS